MVTNFSYAKRSHDKTNDRNLKLWQALYSSCYYNTVQTNMYETYPVEYRRHRAGQMPALLQHKRDKAIRMSCN